MQKNRVLQCVKKVSCKNIKRIAQIYNGILCYHKWSLSMQMLEGKNVLINYLYDPKTLFPIPRKYNRQTIEVRIFF